MSYSFQVRAATAALALAAVAEKMAEVVRNQPSHVVDAPVMQKLAESQVGLLTTIEDLATKDVSVSCSGSLSGHWAGAELPVVTSSNSSCSAALVDRPAA